MSRSDRKRRCARVVASFPDDERLKRIPFGPRRGRALGVWVAALCHSTLHGLDGFCPTEALHRFNPDEAIQDLVDVGLFARGEKDGLVGVVVVNDGQEINGLLRKPVAQAASDEAKTSHGRRAS